MDFLIGSFFKKMNMNNFSQQVSVGAKKIALAGLVCAAVLVVAVTILITGQPKQEIFAAGCGNVGETCYSVGDEICRCGTTSTVKCENAHLETGSVKEWVGTGKEYVINCGASSTNMTTTNPSTTTTTTSTTSSTSNSTADYEGVTEDVVIFDGGSGDLTADQVCGMSGQTCDPDNASDKMCIWCGSMGKHAFCGADNLWAVNNDIEDYCTACGEDEQACSCSFRPGSDSTQIEPFPMGAFKCGAAGELSENFSYKCVATSKFSTDTTGTGHGVLFDPTATACLNQKCGAAGECENTSKTTECNAMNAAVIELFGYIKDGYISDSGTETAKAKNDDDIYIGVKTFISNFKSKYGETLLGLAASKYKLFGGQTLKREDIACTNDNELMKCDTLGDGKTYSFKCESGPKSCLVWNWLIGSSYDECKDGCNMENGVDQGTCKDNAVVIPGEAKICADNNVPCEADPDCQSGTAACGLDYVCGDQGYCIQGCRGSDDKEVYEIGQYKCGGTASSSNVSNICKEKEGWAEDENCEDSQGTCQTETGKCTGSGEGGECANISVNKGSAYETTSKCGGKSCSGMCVPFTVKETGECSSIACTVTNDYDGGAATGFQSGSSAQWYACMTPKSKSGSTSEDTNAGSNPDTIKYVVKCTDSKSGKTSSAEGSCGFPIGNDNPYSEKEDEVQDEETAEEGEDCTKDSECEEGLVCEDGTCKEACTKDSDCNSGQNCKDGACVDGEGTAAEGEDCTKDGDCEEGLVCEDGTCTEETAAEAPTVSVTAPTGTVTAKTAQLTVTTNLSATCKYMDITAGGSYTAANFSGSGMTMSSSGYTHVATLNSLANTASTSSDCKKAHNIVVLCQNTEAKDQNAVESIGSGQASFTVDLSANTEYAPTVTSSLSTTSFTVANPILKVTTDRPASCQYKLGGTFTYGSGEDFTTTGSYSHNTELSDLETDDYTYYVVCKDIDTCAANTGLKIDIKVTLEGGESTMTVASATAASQTVTNPTVSVTTDLPATCQYNVGSTFTYGSGTQFTNDNDYSHTSSLSALEDGDYQLYVVCKEKETGLIKVLADPIATTLDRGASENEPAISNTTEVSQSTDKPIIQITTEKAAKCQYSEDADFTYGGGTQFTTDGSTGHSVELSDIEDGDYTYYIICKDVATGTVNSEAIEIVFAVSNTANTCADLDSNDEQNDLDRDYGDGSDSDSKYVWRSVEDGTRDEFTKVDWYAGYQFTSDKDGYVTQLCGYFADGESNEVTLYNGSYKELATATVEGSDDWECVSITPASVKTDKRYYVIARVEDSPIYYEYQSGLLPLDAENVVVESGIRQLAEDDFGEDVFKYDYMVFGLVDVKFVVAGESEDGPKIDINGPIGSIDDDSTTLSVETDANAECRFGRDDVEYSDMEYDFGKTGVKLHEQKICKLDDGYFTFYVRCKDEDGEENDVSTLLQFEVSN